MFNIIVKMSEKNGDFPAWYKVILETEPKKVYTDDPKVSSTLVGEFMGYEAAKAFAKGIKVGMLALGEASNIVIDQGR